jgi:Subtilase family
MVANVTDRLLKQLITAGAQVLHQNARLRSIRAIISPQQIEGIAASPDVIFISPKQGSATARIQPPVSQVRNNVLRTTLTPGFAKRADNMRRRLAMLLLSTPGVSAMGQGSVETEGDLTHRALGARGAFGVNGAGLKIGVLSDGDTSRALSQATGDLPPDCGTPPCVSVLPGQDGFGDEGTAMMEIIHDMAPGASLVFATADNDITSFAQNIHDLRFASHCDIIVDDVFYFVETPFQDGQTAAVTSTTQAGVVTQAVNDVVADGALYFSAAGNEGNLDTLTSGTFEGDFNGVASTTPLPAGKVHNFGSANFDIITFPGIDVLGLWWADPLGASTNDYDLYVLDSTGTTIVAASTNIQNGTQDAVELIGSFLSPGNLVVVFQNAGAADRFFHLVIFRGGLTVNTAGETHGHSAASGAYTVAATPAAAAFEPPTPDGPFPNPFTVANKIEAFSSDGLRHIFFNGDSSAITPGNFSSMGGRVLNKPDITAADGVSVTGVGGFGSPFYGTSAAAPAAASVAALVKSAKPSLTAAEMRTALTSTAVDIMDPGFDRDSGSGIVMAFEAINSLGVPGSANPELGTIIANENPGNGNGVIEPGEGAIIQIQLKNTNGVQAATGVTATLTSSTPGVLITQPGTSAYADMAVGDAGENNLSPFTFTLASNYPCGQTADFTLTVNYTGGPQRVLNFTVSTGLLNITNTLGTQPVAPAGITTATGTQTDRINRNGVPSACGTPKLFPGTIASGPRTFDSYTFTACQATCMTVGLNSSSGIGLFESVYSPSYDPTNIATNFQGDAGLSGNAQSFGITSTAATPYTIVVNDVNGASFGSSYTLQIPACALNCKVNHLPIALAHNVTVAAANTGGTATASIDNGSSDPDGDPITLTQTPPGPYSLGNTSVLLTVVDTKGATAQASATVTVVNPDFTVAMTSPSLTVLAGQSATEHITFTPNPGIGSALTFSCSGLPALAACSFAPSTVPAGSSATDVVLTVTTTGTNAALTRPRTFYASWMPLAGLGLLGIIFVSPGKRRRTTALLMSVVLMGVMTLLVGCGTTHATGTGATTPKGTSTITVTSTSGNVTHTATFSLTVN